MAESIVTVNLQINDHTNEIEYIKMETVGNNSSDDDETEQGEQIDEENVLVAKSDGVMTIKTKKKTVLEHICAKCNKSYKTLVVSWIGHAKFEAFGKILFLNSLNSFLGFKATFELVS